MQGFLNTHIAIETREANNQTTQIPKSTQNSVVEITERDKSPQGHGKAYTRAYSSQ